MTKPLVFISSPSDGMAEARELRRQLETTANVAMWSDVPASPNAIGESLTELADRADFAVFILTSRFMSVPPARSGMLFELGFFAGRLGLSRIFVIVDPKIIELPSDLAGTTYIPFSTSKSSDVGAVIAPIAAIIQQRIGAINAAPYRPRVDYSSCFLSYSVLDQEFAVRLHADLGEVGVRSWLDARDMKTGDKVASQIDMAIQTQDKVLLILSHNSIMSSWVRKELKIALELEAKRHKIRIFPIRLDDAIFDVSGIREFDQLKDRHIADFRQWQDRNRYQRAFSQLVRDLAISASVEAERAP